MVKIKKGYNLFRRFCAFVLGSVFLISGILKLMDPVGSEFVMKAYFDFLHIGFMGVTAKFFGVAFAFVEAVLGAALMSGVWRKVVGIAVIALTTFFTLLTLVLLIFNPTMDCGCFGEAIHLTHLQSFIKNIALCVLCCGAFIPLRELDRPVKVKYVSFALSALSIVFLMVYSLIALPMKDYTSFRMGTILQAAADEEYRDFTEPEFIYEKDGVTESFSLDNLPDSSWTFVDSRIRQADFVAGAVLSLRNREGEYCDTVASEGNVLAFSAYRKLSKERAEALQTLVATARELGLKTILLVPSDDILEDVSFWRDTPVRDNGAEAAFPDIYYSDFKTLATLNRSNGGVTYISDGQIVRKWSYILRPDREKLEAALAQDPTSLALETQSKGSLYLQGFLLYVFAVLLLL